ncbi:hypothetical protein [Shewanella sp.]|uniref:hypothetical protein n=1 Tax=Shewanella sp. TaxID=50422 RepID=UPI002638D12E|nr:hypothetical protein [Shewanella sp.]
MRKFIPVLYLASLPCYAGFTLDLTDPENLTIADLYPSYEAIRTLSFSDTGKNMSLVGFKLKKESDEWNPIFSATIGSTIKGKQTLYISLDIECSGDKEILEASVIKTNDQNVKYSRYCGPDKKVYMTPTSAAGENFLINEFKKKDMVKFEFSDITIFFDAEGFSKSWSSYGGDAL